MLSNHHLGPLSHHLPLHSDDGFCKESILNDEFGVGKRRASNEAQVGGLEDDSLLEMIVRFQVDAKLCRWGISLLFIGELAADITPRDWPLPYRGGKVIAPFFEKTHRQGAHDPPIF